MEMSLGYVFQGDCPWRAVNIGWHHHRVWFLWVRLREVFKFQGTRGRNRDRQTNYLTLLTKNIHTNRASSRLL
jgi:hypothetical protein